MASEGFHVYRRNLPDWRLTGAIYFVTWRLASSQAPLTVFERSQIAEVLSASASGRYHLLAYVVMDDHAHVLIQPNSNVPLERLMHSWKSYTAHLLQRAHRRGRIWQREYCDRIIRDEKELDAKLQYILLNPSRRWPGVTEYPWV